MEGWRERGRERGKKKTLTKALRISNQPSPPGWVSSYDCWIQTTVPVRTHLSAGQTKEREGKNRGRREEKWGRQSQEASLKIPPSSGILSIFSLGYCFPVCACVCVCICCLQLLFGCVHACICVLVSVSSTESIYYSKSKYMPASNKCFPDETKLHPSAL